MHRRDGKLIVAATDLVAFLECGHLTNLDRALADNLLAKPDVGDDPALELLRWRGGEHEKRYIAMLRESDRVITDLTRHQGREARYAELAAKTEDAMRRGDDVIYQGFVFDGRWLGYPDFLLRVEGEFGARWLALRGRRHQARAHRQGQCADPDRHVRRAGRSYPAPRCGKGQRRHRRRPASRSTSSGRPR